MRACRPGHPGLHIHRVLTLRPGICPIHLMDHKQRYDARRLNSNQRGYTARWQRARKQFLDVHPLCCLCLERGEIVTATVVHHTVKHNGDMVLFWDETKWQSVCEDCHNSIAQSHEKSSSISFNVDGIPLSISHPWQK